MGTQGASQTATQMKSQPSQATQDEDAEKPEEEVFYVIC